MVKTSTGADKIKQGLPPGVMFGHKTGSSSRTADGIKIADNDAGFVTLTNGRTYYIAVMITESKLDDRANAALAAQISQTVYNYLTTEKPTRENHKKSPAMQGIFKMAYPEEALSKINRCSG